MTCRERPSPRLLFLHNRNSVLTTAPKPFPRLACFVPQARLAKVRTEREAALRTSMPMAAPLPPIIRAAKPTAAEPAAAEPAGKHAVSAAAVADIAAKDLFFTAKVRDESSLRSRSRSDLSR